MIIDVNVLYTLIWTCSKTGYYKILNSVKYTQKMKSLEPDVEEQALLAGISMFSPFLRKVRDHDDIHLLTKIQVRKNSINRYA